MISETGAITENGNPAGQLQIVEDADGNKKVQLYNKEGTFLVDCPFDGDGDKGLEIGMGLYRGYARGWDNAEFAISRSVSKALNTKSELKISV